LQTEIGLGQPKIGLVQLEAQSERLCEDLTEVPSCQDSAATNTTVIAASTLSVVDPCAQKRKAIGRPVARTKARSDGRCDALIAIVLRQESLNINAEGNMRPRRGHSVIRGFRSNDLIRIAESRRAWRADKALLSWSIVYALERNTTLGLRNVAPHAADKG
jgi:hypothetical protein